MKKLTILVVAVLAVTLMLLPAMVQAKETKIVFWTENLKTFDGFFLPLIAEFEKQNPGVKVVWEDKPADKIQAFLAASAAGIAPDVINFNVVDTARLAQKGALLDIGNEVSEAEKGIFFKGLWDSLTLEDGGTYGFPWYVTTRVIMYNKAIFEKAGIDPNKPPKTWDEVGEYAKTIKDKTGLYGYQPPTSPTDFVQEIRMFGIQPIKNGKANVNAPGAVARLTYWRDMVKADYFPQSWEKGFWGAWEQYLGGRMGMAITAATLLPRLKKEAPSVYENTLVAPMPMGPGKTLPAAMFAIDVSKSSRNKDVAVAFAKFLTNDENQLAFAKYVGTVLPATKKAASDSYFSKSAGSIDDRARYIMMQQLYHAADMTITVEGSADLYQTLKDAIGKAILDQMTPQAALDEAAVKWDKVLSK